MKLASYNVENLFQRAKALNLATWEDGRDILQLQAALNRVLGKAKYTSADKKKIVDLMKKLKIDKKDDGPFVILRQNRGHLVKRPKNRPIESLRMAARIGSAGSTSSTRRSTRRRRETRRWSFAISMRTFSGWSKRKTERRWCAFPTT